MAFLLALLNCLDTLYVDIVGAYSNAKCAEMIYTMLGPDFGDLEGRTTIVENALYGLGSIGYAWRSTLARTLHEKLKFKKCSGDMDVWEETLVEVSRVAEAEIFRQAVPLEFEAEGKRHLVKWIQARA